MVPYLYEPTNYSEPSRIYVDSTVQPSRPGLVVLALLVVHTGHAIVGRSQFWMFVSKGLELDLQALLVVL